MKKEFVKGLAVFANIFDGNSHIERRVYVDEFNMRHVKINGDFVSVEDCKNICKYEVSIYF